MSKKSGKKKGNVIHVDFTGVDVRTLVPEGDHRAKVLETSIEEGEKGQYIKWTLAVVADGEKFDGSKLFNNTSLAANSLWNLRAWLIALGIDVPASPNDIDLDECVGQELMVHVEHETWEGKERARITDFQPIDGEVEDDDKEDDDEDDKDEVEDDEDEKEDDDEDEDKEDDDEGEDDDDDEPSLTADQVREMDEDELADLNKKHKLGVDFKTVTKASKRLKLVIAALEKKELIAS